MILKDTTSCAMQEISGLSNYSTPQEAMKAFCRLNFDENGETCAKWTGAGRLENTNKDSLFSFYLFSAAVPLDGKKSNSSYFRPYGIDFKAFIEANNLGTVWESPVKQNKTFHTDHGNQIYVWTIDQEAVKKWWQKERTKKQETTKQSIPTEDFILEDISYDYL